MPSRKSLVWKFFQKNSSSQAECLLCSRKIKMVFSGTSSLRKHIIRKHPVEGQILLDQKVADTVRIEEDRQSAAVVAADIGDMKPLSSDTGSKRRTSTVWNFFTLNPDAPNSRCNICNSTLAYTNNSTSNLRKHILHRHPSLSSQLLGYDASKGAPAISNTNNVNESSPSVRNTTKLGKPPSTLSVTSGALKKKYLDDKMVEMIALDLQPVSIVESKGFVNLVAALNPQYAIPSRKTVTSELLPTLYKQTMDVVLKRLEGIKHVALTTDMWSHGDHEIYLGITAHFICPSEWSLQSVMLSTTAFIGSPTGKEISCELQRIVTEWNLSHKVTVMVTDNETNTLLANEQLPWAYIPCFGHLIHLVVTNAITADEEASALIEKVNDVVNFFHHNQEAGDSLVSMQSELNLPEHKLISNVASRWNSIYYMLERMYEQFEAVNAVLEMYLMTGKRMSEQDREMMNMIISSLKPFEVATLSLSSDESSNISVAMPLVKGLVKMMSSVTGAKEPLTANLKEGLVSSFGKMEEIEWIMIATLLDPRFKKFPFAAGAAIEKARENILSEVSDIVEAKPKPVIQLMTQIDSTNCVVRATTTSTSKSGNDSFWNYFDVMTSTNDAQEKEVPSAASREVQCYLDSAPIPRSEDPLFYWKQHEELLPNLYKVAMKYMSVPITSIPPARLFTKVGETYAQKTSKMKPKNINVILFLNRNMNMMC